MTNVIETQLEYPQIKVVLLCTIHLTSVHA